MKDISGVVNWGIIGCGDVCEVKSGPAFSKVNNSALVAVMRRDKEKAKDFATRHNVPNYFDDVDSIINNKDINAVYIATPPASHEEYAIACMKAGKPVYIEKPVTVNSASVERMIAASKKYNVQAVVAHYRRALPLFLKVRELIESGSIGKVRVISLRLLQSLTNNVTPKTEVNWRTIPALSGGGHFHDLAPHQLDIITWLFGEPVSIRGNSINQAKQYDAPDVTTLDMIFKNDVVFQGLWSFNVHEKDVEDTCHIIGEKGSLKFPFFRSPMHLLTVSPEEKTLELTVPKHIQEPMISDVVKFFRGDGPNPCTLEESLTSMKMMDSTIH